MPAPEIAVAYVSVVPEVSGFTRELRRQILGPSAAAGGNAGDAAGNAFTRALGRADTKKAFVGLLLTGAAAAGAQAGAAGTTVGLAFANSLAAAAAGGGALFAAVKPQLAQITSASQAYTKAQDAQTTAEYKTAAARKLASKGGKEYQDALKAAKTATNAAKTAQDDYKASLSGMTPATRATATAFMGLKDDFKSWSDSLSGTTMPIFTSGIQKLRGALPLFTPIVKDASGVVKDFVDNLGAGKSGAVFSEFATNIRSNAAPALRTLLQAGKDLATGFVGVLNAFQPMTAGLQSGLTNLTGKFADFGANLKGSPGFQKFLEGIRAALPGIAATMGSLATVVGHLMQAFAGLGPAAFGVLGILARIAAALPIPVLQALIVAWSAWRLAVIGHTAAIRINTAWQARQRVATLLTAAASRVARVATLAWTAVQGGLRLAMDAAFIGRYRAAMVLNTIAMRAARLATLVWTGVQVAFNAVMSANPIVLVVLAIAALVAGVILAYNKVGWFRDLVQGAWQGIQAAASFAWNNVLKPIFNALAVVVMWLWNTIIKPYFRAVGAAFSAIGTALKVVWDNVLSPVFTWIGDKVKWLWTTYIKPHMGYIRAIFRSAGDTLKAVWTNVLSPVLGWIGEKVKWLWTTYIRPHIGEIKIAFKAMGIILKWVWSNVLSPVLGWIGAKAKWLWNSALKPAFSATRVAIKSVGASFSAAKEIIRTAWNQVGEIAKKPVRFLINTVYNGGIVPLWNKIASAFGAPSLKQLNIKGFATGGILPGYTPGRDVHLAALSGGEAIMRPEWTRAMGPGYVNAMNAAARSGGVGAIRRMTNSGLPAYKDGGIFGWIGSAANTVKGWGSSAWDTVKGGAAWLGDTIAGSAKAGVKAMVNPLINLIPGLDTGWGQSIKHIPEKIVNSIFSFSGKADEKGAASLSKYTGGGKLGDWIAKAMKFTGVPAGWAAPLRTLIMRESGGNPNAINRWDSNAKAGHPSQGLMQTIPGTFAAYRDTRLPNKITDPIANIVAGINYILTRYGSIFNVQQAVGSTPKGYDNGGWLMPGANQTVYNKTGRPEAVFTADQWSSIHTLAARGAGGLQNGTRVTFITQGGQFEAIVDARADARIHEGLVAPASLGRTL